MKDSFENIITMNLLRKTHLRAKLCTWFHVMPFGGSSPFSQTCPPKGYNIPNQHPCIVASFFLLRHPPHQQPRAKVTVRSSIGNIPGLFCTWSWGFFTVELCLYFSLQLICGQWKYMYSSWIFISGSRPLISNINQCFWIWPTQCYYYIPDGIHFLLYWLFYFFKLY